MITGHREPPFHVGVVEARNDPLKIGRVRVRVVGLHTHDKTVLPTNDLPWCYCIQPVSSAGISGIGQAPVGPIEGTWVAVQYLDQDKQNPFVVGTLPGISHAQTFFNNAPSQGGNYEVKPNGDVQAPWTDYSGQPVGDGKFNPAGTYTTSKEMIQKIKQHESFKAKAYDDGTGVWTIGYGTTFINGAPVSRSTPDITEAQAAELFTKDLVEFEKAVKSVVTTNITQSMFDAMVSLAYNIGSGAYRKSSVVREINARNYAKAGDHFRDWRYAGGKVMAGLESRRNAERSWYLREGVGETNAPTAAALAVPGSQGRTAAMLAAPGTPVALDTLATESAIVQPSFPLARIMDFGPASGMALSAEDKAKIVASGSVKLLSKAEYVANILNDPPVFTASQGGGSDDGAPQPGKTRTSWATVEVSHPDLFQIIGLEQFIKKPLKDKSWRGNEKDSPPDYTDNGIAIRNTDGTLKRKVAFIGSVQYDGVWEFANLSIEFDTKKFIPEDLMLSDTAWKINVVNDVKDTGTNTYTVTSDVLFATRAGHRYRAEKTGPLYTHWGHKGISTSTLFHLDLSISDAGGLGFRGIYLADPPNGPPPNYGPPLHPNNRECIVDVKLGTLYLTDPWDGAFTPKLVAENAWVRITLPIDIEQGKKV